MEKEIFDKYIEAGRINKEAKEYARKIIKPGIKLLEIAEAVESFIKEKGGELAFPINLSLNNIAAHYTPDSNDKTILGDKDVLKVDIGVHVDGYIADSAFTISFDEKHNELIEASKTALKNALKIIKPGLEIKEVGKVIENTIKEFDLIPVSNLTGHGLERYQIHTKYSIPNINVNIKGVFKEGDVIAIEPFATNGSGFVRNSSKTFIYSLKKISGVRNIYARKILKEIENTKGLPFAKRHIYSVKGIMKDVALKELEKNKIIEAYPVLKDAEGSFVSQAEHTIIVEKNPVITT